MEIPGTSSIGMAEVKEEPDETVGRSKFQVDMALIPSANLGEDVDDLKALNIGVFNQEDLEQGKATGATQDHKSKRYWTDFLIFWQESY